MKRDGHTATSAMEIPDAASLRRMIDNHLLTLGFSRNGDGYFVDGELSKQRIRDLHSVYRQEILADNQLFVDRYGPELVGYIATGRQVNPEVIDPELV